MILRRLFLPLFLFAPAALHGGDSAPKYFEIRVVDDVSGRGVPLVELKTVHNVCYYTDSAGRVAFYEPGLMNQNVFFYVKSHGYEFPKDGFGFRGKALEVKPGGEAVLKIKRLNIAERLYRITGAGIYRDTLLLGKPAPIKQPVLNGQVLGSDSVVTAIYKGKVYWFWGDTNRPAYPLGNFHVPGATSLLPTDKGIDPEQGVDLAYFLDGKGFAKETARLAGTGPTWINGLVVLRDDQGGERMFAAYAKIKGTLEVYQRGLVEFDDGKKQFVKVVEFPMDAPQHPGGHPFLHKAGGAEYVYFANPYPLRRVPARAEAMQDFSKYESFSCLTEGARLKEAKVQRDSSGKVVWAWRKNTPAIGPAEENKLVKAGLLKAEETLLNLRDVHTGNRVLAHGGSVYWNAHRRRWVMIAVESFGSSFLGEVWYAEADGPLGPWVYAKKVVTHDKYSFYNPKQHPFFDRDNGRFIYFEGTYTQLFSGNQVHTPYYDYNQMMYRLDLDDERLHLPVAVYRKNDELVLGAPGLRIAFFALDRPGKNAVPIFGDKTKDRPLFYIVAPQTKDVPAGAVPLHEFVHQDGKTRVVGIEQERPGFQRSAQSLGWVWANPVKLALAWE